jgi:histidyl-tRNA synthetase
LIGEKKLCSQCNKEAEVVDVKPSNGNEVQVLSCGHLMETPQSIHDAIADLPTAYETISAASKQINSLNDILLLVDKSELSQEEKSKTKEILSILDKEKDNKTLSQIKSLLDPLKTWLPVAGPYINLLVTIILRQ